MSQQILARKRTRSQAFSKEQRQEGEPKVSKRQIVEVSQADQTHQNSSHQNKKEKTKQGKEIRKKHKKVQENTNKEQNSAKKQQDSKPIKNQQLQNEKIKKKKRKQKDDEEQKEQKRKKSQAKAKKHKKKGQKKDKDNDSDQDVKQQETNKNTDKQKEEQKQKNKKKKKHKNKQKQPEQQQIKKPPESSINAKEQEEQNEKSKKKKKKDSQKKQKSKKSKKDKKEKKKKKKKEESGSSSESQSDQEQSNNQSSDEDNQKTKKIKKEVKKRKGRKPLGPIKRKKSSIFQQQQIINKKYRVKKKSTYLNKMSDRAWGQLRAGPYRDVKKYTKAQQRKIIDSLLGDGPKKQTSHSQKGNKQTQSVKIENEKQIQHQKQTTQNEEKMEEENSRNQQDSSDDKKSKSKSKSKQKKNSKKGKSLDDNQKTPSSTKASRSTKSNTKAQKKSKSKKKYKQDNSSEESADENEAKIQHGEENKSKSRSKKKKKKAKDDSDSSSNQQSAKKSKRKSTKKDVKHQAQKKTKVKEKKEEDIEFPKQESQRIIDLFAADGGNYPEMMKELAGIPLKKVRLHLRMLFHRALDIITYQVQHRCGRKIKQWQQDQKVQIVRELHRIRSSNRLLSQANVHFRDNMTALMRSYNDQSWLDKVSETDIQTMYKKLQAFVRGYNTINRSKRNGSASITQNKHKQKQQRYKFNKEVTRKPIICGGHLLSKSMKSEYKEQTVQSEFDDRSRSVLPPQKLIQEWNREEQKALCQLYVNNQQPDEVICEKLKERYGPNIKWRDFQLLGRKIDQLIKYALIKLQNLTARPYCRQQRERQLQKKRAKLQQKLKRQNEHYSMNYYKQKLKTTSMFLYDNEIFQKEERLEYKHRIFKNLSLLERQIFGHIESYKLKNTLVKILIDEFPPEEDVEAAVKQAKRFSRWAREDQKKSNITSIKNVFIGERQDRDFRDNDHNQDSIMADIQKIEITRKQGYMPQSKQFSDEGESRSILFAQSASGRAQQPIQIQNDNDSVQISDFEQPQSVRSNSNSQCKSEGEKFQMLQKLYQSLNGQLK